MFQIRKIKPEDIGFVIQLTNENVMEQGKLLSNIENFLICESNSVKCGCGCLVISGSEGFLNWIAVSEENRGNGLGGAIMKALLNIAEHKGVEEAYAPGICPGFLKALDFHETSCDSAVIRGKEALGISEAYDFFMVSIEGYFKPCSQK